MLYIRWWLDQFITTAYTYLAHLLVTNLNELLSSFHSARERREHKVDICS